MAERVRVLVGREIEVARLRGLVMDVANGRGGSVWVDGEPGIGKTAVLSAGLADAELSGCGVFASQAAECAELFPLRVLLDALRVEPHATDAGRSNIAAMLWGGGSAEAVTPGDAVAAAAELLVVLVQRLCAVGPIVLVVDDMQWADEMSIAVWGRLHRVVSQLPLLLVAAARPVPQRAELDRLRRGVAADSVVIGLGPLPEPQVTELVGLLVAATPGPNLRQLAGQAGGNPLYVRELVDALLREERVEIRAGSAELSEVAGSAPASLAAAIAARLGFLSRQATDVLQMAALLGAEFDAEHLRLLTGREATELVGVLREALAGGVLAESGTRLAFRHALIRQALYEATPAALRSVLHRQAAEALAAADAPYERVADQLLAALKSGSFAADAWVVEWVASAAATLTYRAPQIALDLLQRVRQATSDIDGPRQWFDAHAATALFLLGRYEEVEHVASPALASTRDPMVAGRIAWTLGYSLQRMGRYEQAAAVTGRAFVEQTLNAVWDARVRAMHAMALVNLGRYDEAQSVAAEAETGGRRVRDRLALGYALHTRSMVETRHREGEAAALRTIDRALEAIGEELETTDLRVLLLGNRAAALANLDRLTEADHTLGQALTLAERSGTPPRLARLRTVAADVCILTGRWDDALAELDATPDLPPNDVERLYKSGLLALVAVHRDDRATLRRLLHDVDDLRISDSTVRYYAQHLLTAWALAAERDGQPRQALARLLALFDPESTRDFPEVATLGPQCLPDLVRLAIGVGDQTAAEAGTRACVEELSRRPLPRTLASTEHCRGLLTADPTLVRSAANTFSDAGYPLYRAHALENAAVLHAEQGDLPAARAAYTDALHVYTGLDASWDIQRCDSRLRPLGLRRGVRGPRGRPATGWDALTQTELKIARLVAAGNSNPDIAAELFLSRTTVITHISHILAKLDAHSRVDIAREVTRRRHAVVEP